MQSPGRALGQILARARQRRGLTQMELGVLTDCAAITIAHYEQGSRTPSLVPLMRIARALDTPLSALISELDEYPLPALPGIDDMPVGRRPKREWRPAEVDE